MFVITILASVVLTLAVVGLYGLLSYDVVCRRREFGIRLALGAQPSQIVSLVSTNAFRSVVASVVIALPLGIVAARLLRLLVFGAGLFDPVVLGAVVILLIAVVYAASVWPALNAAQVSPAESLRTE